MITILNLISLEMLGVLFLILTGMPLRPNLIERLLIKNGIIPTILLDTGVSMFQASVLLTAGEIRLFNYLKENDHTFEELKKKTSCSLHGSRVVLTCMLNLGYINKKGDYFSLSKSMKRSFPIDLFPEMVPFFRSVNEKLNNSTEAVINNPSGGIMGWDFVKAGEVGKSYQTLMRWLGLSSVKEVVSRINMPISPERMLDIGGSPLIGLQTQIVSVRAFVSGDYQIIYEIVNDLIMIVMIWDCRLDPEDKVLETRIK